MTSAQNPIATVGKRTAAPTRGPANHYNQGTSTTMAAVAPPASFMDKQTLSKARVLVTGDAMLDRYWFGDAERISPEAPVPVVRISR